MENKFFETHKKKLQFFAVYLLVFNFGAVIGIYWDTSNNEKLNNLNLEFNTYKADTQKLVEIVD